MYSMDISDCYKFILMGSIMEIHWHILMKYHENISRIYEWILMDITVVKRGDPHFKIYAEETVNCWAPPTRLQCCFLALGPSFWGIKNGIIIYGDIHIMKKNPRDMKISEQFLFKDTSYNTISCLGIVLYLLFLIYIYNLMDCLMFISQF